MFCRGLEAHHCTCKACALLHARHHCAVLHASPSASVLTAAAAVLSFGSSRSTTRKWLRRMSLSSAAAVAAVSAAAARSASAVADRGGCASSGAACKQI